VTAPMNSFGAEPKTALDPDAAPVRSEIRLRVRSTKAASAHVDGAWWPRSRDPVAEFPGLVLAMSSWIGPVHRVAYHLDDWDMTARELTVEGWVVSLVGSPTVQANTVVVDGPDQRRMSLLVVPPDTPSGIARAVLVSTAGPDAVDSIEEILASNGVDTTRSVGFGT
jgi:hypothetical protein